jgi:hypothetical protein
MSSHAGRYAYRLKAWPDLPVRLRTAPVLRTLSRMSHGPVTHNWFVHSTRLPVLEAEALLACMEEQEWIECIDFEAGL